MVSDGRQDSHEAQPEAAAQLAAPFWRLVLKNGNTIVPFNEIGNGPAFYFVHPIAGDVTSFHELAKSLGPAQRVYGIQVPKNKMTPAFGVSIEAVARHHVEKLVAFQPKGPIVLGGWSAGAIIALEMAQQLRALGRDVPLLIAFDGAPSNTGAGMNRWSPIYNWKLICNLPGWFRYQLVAVGSFRTCIKNLVKKFSFRAKTTLSAFKNEQTLDGSAVRRFMENSGGLSDQMPFIRAMYDAMRTYIPRHYSGRVILYEATAQPYDHLLQLGAAWTRITEKLEIVRLAGSHNTIFKEPSIGTLSRHLRTRLAELEFKEASRELPESTVFVDRTDIDRSAT